MLRSRHPPFAAQFAEIEVDIETGEPEIMKLVTAVDCGVPVNPVTATGQVEGGMLSRSATRRPRSSCSMNRAPR